MLWLLMFFALAGAAGRSLMPSCRARTSFSLRLRHPLHQSLSESSCNEYEYLDSGSLRRLERFGNVHVIRACPSATWIPGLPVDQGEWKDAKVRFDASGWQGLEHVPEDWCVHVHSNLVFSLLPSEQGQLGIFPEQLDNWNWLHNQGGSGAGGGGGAGTVLNVLNGFAYTGGSSIAALGMLQGKGGDEAVKVTHLDAAKASVSWAARNAVASGFENASCRFLVDDCLTFLHREVKRGNKYEGLIFDPPAFGRGGGNKIWKLDKDLPTLVSLFPALLSSSPRFLLLSCHDVAWSSHKLEQLLREVPLPTGGVWEKGGLTLKSNKKGARDLPLGQFVRISWKR